MPSWTRSSSGPQELVRLIRAAGVTDARVLEAFGSVPRAAFVPAGQVDRAYRDEPIPIPRGQVTTQPSLVAAMVEALALRGHERVLEVGTGLGYQAAILARLASEVWTVELRLELAVAARANLAAERVRNVHVTVGDGGKGLPDHAPYDAIAVAAAYPLVPPPLVEQLGAGGRLVQPIGTSGAEDVTLFRRAADGRLVRVRTVMHAYFVPLYGRYGFVE
jgi:protein-L-isoaspartate(D-aspartate) O-methyltransferase